MRGKPLSSSDDLWKGIDLVADDIDTRSSVQCPSFRVAKVTVAGT
jgi:predicted Zn-dependent protease